MRYNKEKTRQALIYECSRSASNSEIKKYALEMVEDLNDGEYFKNPTLKNVRKRMLGGLSDYAQTGCGEEMAKMLEKVTCYFYCFAVFDKTGAMKYDRIRTLQSINALKSGSAWGRAVNEYAYELAESIEDGEEFKDIKSFAKALLNGASDWREYSEGGCSLISDYEIAKRLCTPSEFKKKKHGELPPSGGMSWIELQARALSMASRIVTSNIKSK